MKAIYPEKGYQAGMDSILCFKSTRPETLFQPVAKQGTLRRSHSARRLRRHNPTRMYILVIPEPGLVRTFFQEAWLSACFAFAIRVSFTDRQDWGVNLLINELNHYSKEAIMDKKWMIYGANGYTGKLVVEEAVRRKLKPVLAGRSRAAIEPLAKSFDLPFKVFSLKNAQELNQALNGIDVVSLCAGPFSATSEPMIKACVTNRAHYLDITGEIDVFVHAHSCQQQAKTAGIVLCPGVGFDVIPTDCVASRLKDALPDATHLALGFDSRGGFSPGTAKTSVEGFKKGNRIRQDGTILPVSLAYKIREIDFGRGPKKAACIPWGDVATAYFSTGIPNIEVFMPGATDLKRLKYMNAMRPIFSLFFMQAYLKKKIEKTVPGPTAEQRKKHNTYVWGEVKNAGGEVKTARIVTANGYDVTVMGVLAAVEFLQTYQGAGGYFTPSLLMGNKLIETFPGSQPMVIS
jgi:short subunit dehydrogenase-like uncharacterized protein